MVQSKWRIGEKFIADGKGGWAANGGDAGNEIFWWRAERGTKEGKER